MSSARAAPSTCGEEMGRVTWAESFSAPILASIACARSLHGMPRLRVADIGPSSPSGLVSSTQHPRTGPGWMSSSRRASVASVACEQFPELRGTMLANVFGSLIWPDPDPAQPRASWSRWLHHLPPIADIRSQQRPQDPICLWFCASGQTSCAAPVRQHGNVERFSQQCPLALSRTNVVRLQIPRAGPLCPRFSDVPQRKRSVATRGLWRSLPWLLFVLKASDQRQRLKASWQAVLSEIMT